MKKEILGYAAGLVDGEGSILIVRTKSPTCVRGYRYHLFVRMTNTRKELCQWLKDNFGGCVFKNGQTSIGNPVWYWQIASSSAAQFLKDISPYIITKRNKLKIALEFQSQRKRVGRKGMTDDEWFMQEQQKQLLHKTK